MTATYALALVALAVFLVPAAVVHLWPMAEAWKRGPGPWYFREEKRGRELWLVVWTPRWEDLEPAAEWAVDRLWERDDLMVAEQQWPDSGQPPGSDPLPR